MAKLRFGRGKFGARLLVSVLRAYDDLDIPSFFAFIIFFLCYLLL